MMLMSWGLFYDDDKPYPEEERADYRKWIDDYHGMLTNYLTDSREVIDFHFMKLERHISPTDAYQHGRSIEERFREWLLGESQELKKSIKSNVDFYITEMCRFGAMSTVKFHEIYEQGLDLDRRITVMMKHLKDTSSCQVLRSFHDAIYRDEYVTYFKSNGIPPAKVRMALTAKEDKIAVVKEWIKDNMKEIKECVRPHIYTSVMGRNGHILPEDASKIDIEGTTWDEKVDLMVKHIQELTSWPALKAFTKLFLNRYQQIMKRKYVKHKDIQPPDLTTDLPNAQQFANIKAWIELHEAEIQAHVKPDDYAMIVRHAVGFHNDLLHVLCTEKVPQETFSERFCEWLMKSADERGWRAFIELLYNRSKDAEYNRKKSKAVPNF